MSSTHAPAHVSIARSDTGRHDEVALTDGIAKVRIASHNAATAHTRSTVLNIPHGVRAAAIAITTPTTMSITRS